MTEKRAGLSAMTLKYIAMATMLVDHMGYVLFPWILWLRCVGRIAFPIFAFQIAEGCIRTHDRRRYALRLLLFAVLTEVPFDLVFSGRPLDPSYQNVLWTLLAGALVCWAADWAQRTPDALHLLAATAAFDGALGESLDIQSDIYAEMSSRGWYQSQQADTQQIAQVRQKFLMN